LTYLEISCPKYHPVAPLRNMVVKDLPVGALCDRLKYLAISCPAASPCGSAVWNLAVKDHPAAVLCEKLRKRTTPAAAHNPRREHDQSEKLSWGENTIAAPRFAAPYPAFWRPAPWAWLSENVFFLGRPREDRDRPAGPAAGGAPPPAGILQVRALPSQGATDPFFLSWEARIILRNPPWTRTAPQGHIYWGANTRPPPTQKPSHMPSRGRVSTAAEMTEWPPHAGSR
jgi:hypothetical protein